ncbi:hypothetical protein CFC21_005389 [Triticum aestivum]|uniref:Uncharacterized protein n=2 Tax=Triticum aestivum TaxID=4565 RepID=A0A9R1D9R8_WHEAT|nr:hypothetical protein CFC21_005383 [Triticum aestivum]KAF6987773.1 hypothetical protein CFC21_005385 [Triticum aestivum]KAF6987777.1 hypothetical protein CFC21_005389 [Triticum aestivum]
MVLSVPISNFTFIAPNFWNMAIASSAQLFLQRPLSIILYTGMSTVVSLSIISWNIFLATTVLAA